MLSKRSMERWSLVPFRFWCFWFRSDHNPFTMKVLPVLALLPFFLTACGGEVPLEATDQVVEEPTDSVENTDPVESVAPVVLEDMMDYYLNLPLEYLPDFFAWEERKEEDVLIQDEENYYLMAQSTYEYSNGPVVLALFLRQDQGPLLALEFRNQKNEEELYFLEYLEGQWIDRTEDYMPEIDWTYLQDYFEGEKEQLSFTLPRYGTEIGARFAETELFRLNWKKDHFEVEYAVGTKNEMATFLFTSGNGFTLNFPSSWEGIQAGYDFGGFGSSEEAPMCTVCGRLVSFYFEDDDLLFNVIHLSLENKGASEIPPDYQYLGENACRVYYGSVLEGATAALKPEISTIFSSFQMTDGICEEEALWNVE